MSEALEVLGYKDAHHMLRGLSNPLEVEMWREAIEAKFHGKGKPYGREEWDQLLGRYQVRASGFMHEFEELIAWCGSL
jgi:hypothetical protein